MCPEPVRSPVAQPCLNIAIFDPSDLHLFLSSFLADRCKDLALVRHIFYQYMPHEGTDLSVYDVVILLWKPAIPDPACAYAKKLRAQVQVIRKLTHTDQPQSVLMLLTPTWGKSEVRAFFEDELGIVYGALPHDFEGIRILLERYQALSAEARSHLSIRETGKRLKRSTP